MIRVSAGTPRSVPPSGAHQAAPHAGAGFDGLGDTWEITERAYFPARRGLHGKIIRINESRWVSIGHSTAAWIEPFGFDAQTGVPGAGFPAWKYGATLWENTFEGELRRIQQVDLLDCYDSSQVQLDTTDGWTWAMCTLRRQANSGASFNPIWWPTWSARRLVIDPETGELSAGPLIVWDYHWFTGGVYAAGDDYGIAAMTPETAVFFASVASTGVIHPTGHLYAVELNLAAGTVGAHTKTDPPTLGWTPAPMTTGSAFGLTASRLSPTDAVVVLYPLNIDTIPSPRHLVVEAHFNGSTFVGAAPLVDITSGIGSGVIGSQLHRPQLNMVFLPIAIAAIVDEDITDYTAYAWVDGVRMETPELVAYNSGLFLVGEPVGGRYAYRYLDWYGDDDHPNGTIGQELWNDLDDSYKDWRLVRYAPRTVLLALDRQLERSLWFNTATDYTALYGPGWEESVGDFLDNSPGNRYEQFMWMLSPSTWCGFHQDTPGQYPATPNFSPHPPNGHFEDGTGDWTSYHPGSEGIYSSVEQDESFGLTGASLKIVKTDAGGLLGARIGPHWAAVGPFPTDQRARCRIPTELNELKGSYFTNDVDQILWQLWFYDAEGVMLDPGPIISGPAASEPIAHGAWTEMVGFTAASLAEIVPSNAEYFALGLSAAITPGPDPPIGATIWWDDITWSAGVRQYVATWGFGGGTRGVASHESSTARIQRGVR